MPRSYSFDHFTTRSRTPIAPPMPHPGQGASKTSGPAYGSTAPRETEVFIHAKRMMRELEQLVRPKRGKKKPAAKRKAAGAKRVKRATSAKTKKRSAPASKKRRAPRRH
jgi:hypothetical protein